MTFVPQSEKFIILNSQKLSGRMTGKGYAWGRHPAL